MGYKLDKMRTSSAKWGRGRAGVFFIVKSYIDYKKTFRVESKKASNKYVYSLALRMLLRKPIKNLLIRF